MSVNKAIIIGRLGQDPELRYTDSGTAVANLSVATDESYTKDGGEKVEQTEWHRVTCWSRLAETVNEYLEKGRQVYVEGSLKTRDWQDSDGNKRSSTEIHAQRVQFLGGGTAEQNSAGNSQRQEPTQPKPSAQQSNGEETFKADDDLPF